MHREKLFKEILKHSILVVYGVYLYHRGIYPMVKNIQE